MSARRRFISPHVHPIMYSLQYHGLEGHEDVPDPFDTISMFLDRFNINEHLKTKTREKLQAIKEKVARIKRNSTIGDNEWDLYGRLKYELLNYLRLYLTSVDRIVNGTEVSTEAADRVLENDQIIIINTILNKYLSDGWRNIKLGGRRKKTRRHRNRRRTSRTKRRHVGKKH